MEKLNIQEAKNNDLIELAALVNSAYRGESSRKGWTTEADFLDGQRTDPESLQKEITGEGRAILVLKGGVDSKILGCVFLEMCETESSRYCYLGMLTIDPNQQASGLGRHLLAEAENWAWARGAEFVELGVIFLRASLMEWYERRGYKKTGKTHPFPYGDERFGLPKRGDLHFILFRKYRNRDIW